AIVAEALAVDDDGATVSYEWTIRKPDNSEEILGFTGANLDLESYIVTNGPGRYVVEVTVIDNHGIRSPQPAFAWILSNPPPQVSLPGGPLDVQRGKLFSVS